MIINGHVSELLLLVDADGEAFELRDNQETAQCLICENTKPVVQAFPINTEEGRGVHPFNICADCLLSAAMDGTDHVYEMTNLQPVNIQY